MLTDAATNVSSTGARFRGVIEPAKEPMWVWFEYGTNTAFGQQTEVRYLNPLEAERPFSELVPNLPPASSIYYRVVASNQFGVNYGFPTEISMPSFSPFTLFEFYSFTNDFATSHLSTADLNGDGWQEIIVSGLKQRAGLGVSVFAPTEVPAHVEHRLSLEPGGQLAPAWADIDRDGDLDFAFAGLSSNAVYHRLVMNRGDLVFEEAPAMVEGLTNSVREVVAWGDSDNDGDVDLLIGGLAPTNGTPSTRLYINMGSNFQAASYAFPPLVQASASWADYD